MTSPADLSKLRINRDAPSAPVRKALWRNLIIFVVAIVVIAIAMVALKFRSAPTVQVITAAATGTTGSSSGGATSVTANGYVVATQPTPFTAG